MTSKMSQYQYPEAVVVQGYAVQDQTPSAPTPPAYTSVMSQQFSSSELRPDEGSTKEYLSTKGWPMGFQDFLLKNAVKMPYRFFICDDSGSMATNDGKRLVGSGNDTKVVSCTRWTEMTESLKFHASLAQALNMPSEFRLLNAASPIMIGGPTAQPEGVAILDTLFNESPGGGTPLCRHIREVTVKVQEMEPFLRAQGQKVGIIIMTDGEASDGDLTQAMAPLQQLPVWVVIRLCTDENHIVEYWNNIDEKLELEMDVLDDLIGEGEESIKANPWLNYAEPLHRLREFGVHIKELDLLDERLLSPDQARGVCALLFNLPLSSIPHPEAEFTAFLTLMTQCNEKLPLVYSLGKKKMMTWINIEKLKMAFGKKNECILS